MLGAYVAPDGNTEEQVNILLKKTKEWAARLDRSYLTPQEALTAYTQVLFPALIYPVAVLALTEQQCDKIVQPTLEALLKKLNMLRTTSGLLLYGPPRYGGLHLLNLYIQGYIIKIMMIIGHRQKNDTTSTILEIVLGTSQQQVGIQTPILETNFEKYSFLLDDGWIKMVWKFLHEMHGSVTISNLWVPQSNYSQDVIIMDRVLEMNIPNSTIKTINTCRLYKKRYHISDLLDSCHRHLHADILNPYIRQTHSDKFPTIEVPRSFWTKWE